MSNNINQKNNKILGGNTIIQFTLKGFISTIIAILGIFFGFYKLIIQPTIKQTAKHQKELYVEQKIYINNEFEEVKNAIQLNTQAINAVNSRFRDLNESVREIENSNGSFGSLSEPERSSINNNINNNNLADKSN
jgi:hypothetical protein